MRWAGLPPVAVIAEIVNPDGTMSRLPELQGLAQRLGLKILTIETMLEVQE